MKTTYLVTTSYCSKCKEIKKWLNEEGIEFTEIETDTDKYGRHMGFKMNIKELPTFIVADVISPDEFKKQYGVK